MTRLLTGSIADLLEGYFESDAMRGLLSVSGVIGTWAGPAVGRNRVRDAAPPHRRDRREPAPGGSRAAGWAAVTGALAAGGPDVRGPGPDRRRGGADPHPRRPGHGVTLASGESIDAPVVITTAHPQISFLRLLDPAELPADFVADIRGWRTRSGTVKINLALDRLPVFAGHPDPDPSVYGGTIVLAEIAGRHRERVPAGRRGRAG